MSTRATQSAGLRPQGPGQAQGPFPSPHPPLVPTDIGGSFLEDVADATNGVDQARFTARF